MTAITSAFGDPTRRAIYLFIHEHAEGATASDVAQHFSLHPNVARHHLEKLLAGGYIEAATSKPEGRTGRPSKRYRVVTPEIALDLPLRHHDVLVTLLGRALAELGPERSEKLAEDVGLSFGRAMAAASTPEIDSRHRSFQSALHTVADALTAHGFAAHAEAADDELRIVSEHCPFGGAAVEHPVICAVDRGMVRGMLEALYGKDLVAETTLSLPTGGERCVTAVTGS